MNNKTKALYWILIIIGSLSALIYPVFWVNTRVHQTGTDVIGHLLLLLLFSLPILILISLVLKSSSKKIQEKERNSFIYMSRVIFAILIITLLFFFLFPLGVLLSNSPAWGDISEHVILLLSPLLLLWLGILLRRRSRKNKLK